ncbi:MAG: Rrf2 family transcriptional regulator [Sedimentisphaerales bacterium]|nr:Rrf2 family transcriptional regulator [Sedimentisphaerales bacterium]
MNVIRQNTDYALRAMVHLARQNGDGPVSARKLAKAERISAQFASKILQQLQAAGLIQSTMGPKGGFSLAKNPAQISLLDVILVAQGPVSLNHCMLSTDVCPLQPRCAISAKLVDLQRYIENYLADISLQDLLDSQSTSTSCSCKGDS